ncbi:MAG TPA: helix-turn-helix transcriptional regulator [Bryobacteraceae bacterium]|nr:helix-turn-helix transcriptional regulator [Bryobacteraceae bacterium]
MSKPADLVQGTLNLLLLKVLALEPMHGWAISQRLNQVSGDVLRVSDGSLYPSPSQAGAGGLDYRRVEDERTGAACEVLLAHASRKEECPRAAFLASAS